MTRLISMVALLLWLFAAAARAADAPRPVRITSAFDADWRFFRGDPAQAKEFDFDDKAWRSLSVPHDWSIEGPFVQDAPTRGAGGFAPAGVGWYRKHFTLPADYAGRRIFVEFDGVMANSDVWINEYHVNYRPYGYVSFRVEITPHLNFGPAAENILVVRADNAAQPASRWYAGAGIYRHVRLVVTDPVHLDYNATFVTTPAIAPAAAAVHVASTVVNQSQRPRPVSLQIALLDPLGQTVATADTPAQTVRPGRPLDFEADLTVPNPRLWDLATPSLYRAVVRVRSDNAVLDDETVAFGIRQFAFKPDTGFWLNGRNFKLKGVCLHHDAGALGAAVPAAAWERRLATLKQFGVNAIRTSHNPVAPEFLDLCDRLGLVVMAENFDCWTVGKNTADYHLYFEDWAVLDTIDTIRRDRNHPSIILYSAGNEIHDTPYANWSKKILSTLIEAYHQNDPTRPVTQALFRPNVSGDYDNGLADMLDVVGQNYRENEILAAYRQKPTRKIVGTENAHDRTVWLALRDNPPYAGQFLWTGIDYLGESRFWPVLGAGSGFLDRTATPKAMAYQRQSWWSDAPMVHIARAIGPEERTAADPLAMRRGARSFSDWSPRVAEGTNQDVEVYSNAQQVELFLNNQSLGQPQARPQDDAPRLWRVPFAPGVLKAVARNNGQIVATHELKTAGKPARLQLTADRTRLEHDWDDVLYVQAAITDDQGIILPDAADAIRFQISGPGAIVALDSGDMSNTEPVQAPQRRAWQGRCFAILRATAPDGQITLTATAPDLPPAAFTLQALPSSHRFQR